jgi:hypothetical protein
MNQGQLLERVYRAMHADILDGVATGGSTTTIVDTLVANKFPQSKFVGWVAFLSTTTDGLAPQSQYSTLSAWTTAGTATMPAVTVAVGAGDTYSFANAKQSIPLQTLIKLCYDGLTALGRIHYIDASITTLDNTKRYTLPIATKGTRPRKITLRDATTYAVTSAPAWDIEPAAPGSTETLVFESEPDVNLKIVIDYLIQHPALTVYSSNVSENVHDELAVAYCMEKAMHWNMNQKRRKLDVDKWQQAKGDLEDAKRMYPMDRVQLQNQRLTINMFN